MMTKTEAREGIATSDQALTRYIATGLGTIDAAARVVALANVCSSRSCIGERWTKRVARMEARFEAFYGVPVSSVAAFRIARGF